MSEPTVAEQIEQAANRADADLTAANRAAVREAVTREAVLAALSKEIGEALAAAKTDVQYLLDQQYEATGTTKVDATLPDGTKVGSISRTSGETAAQIIDAAAFRAWVAEAYPAETTVEIVKSVRPAFSSLMLAAMTAAGVTQWADPETGEVHDVPGVEIRPSRARSHRMTFSRTSKSSPVDGRELVAQAWRRGDLAPIVLPALAPAEQ
ncbi:hypothetical protein [Streptomyces sp. NBC_01217]|uniref:hypothetical protein n=1 Tax=Streptomyces sp. NBC_01217 TaxID=2903779 RepID=UPI002E12D354|nr:hypothetical protein OG507_21125 [Streptomyces sp. NBC_01217]